MENSGVFFGKYLCTAISYFIPSPAKLLNYWVCKGFQPFLQPSLSSFQVKKDIVTNNLIPLKEKGKMTHDRQATDLPKIIEGSVVYGTVIILRISGEKVLL